MSSLRNRKKLRGKYKKERNNKDSVRTYVETGKNPKIMTTNRNINSIKQYMVPGGTKYVCSKIQATIMKKK